MIHSFRRRRLDNFLNRINLLVKGNIIDIGGQRSCCRGMFNGFTNASSRLVVNNNISTNPDILIDIEQYDLKKFGNYNSVICTEVLEYLKNPIDKLSEILYLTRKPGSVLILSVPFLIDTHGRKSDDKIRITPEYLIFFKN